MVNNEKVDIEDMTSSAATVNDLDDPSDQVSPKKQSLSDIFTIVSI